MKTIEKIGGANSSSVSCIIRRDCTPGSGQEVACGIVRTCWEQQESARNSHSSLLETVDEQHNCTQRELIKTGYIGDLWGAQVRQSRRQTVGDVNFLGDLSFPNTKTLVRSNSNVSDEQRYIGETLTAGNPVEDNTEATCESRKSVETARAASFIKRMKIQSALIGNNKLTQRPQYLGVISVRIDLSHMDAPDPQNLFYGWVFFEAIGVDLSSATKQEELALAV